LIFLKKFGKIFIENRKKLLTLFQKCVILNIEKRRGEKMKIEHRVVFTEEEEKAVAKVVKLLEELVEENDIYNAHVEYNPADDIALDELWGMMDSFQRFVDCPCEWKIDD
jgi:hypothetical protein